MLLLSAVHTQTQGVTMSKRVTKSMAVRTLKAIETSFASWVQEGYGPKLLEDWDGHDFVIVWEEGAPYDWAFLLDGGTEEEYGFKVPAAKIPSTVWTEPINHCVIGLYRV